MPPPRSPYAHLPVNPLSIPKQFNFATSIVDHHAANLPPDTPALQWVSQDLSTSHKLSYSYFSRRSHLIASFLTNTLGLVPGDLLILILPRVPEWWELAIACLRAGIILCPCTTLLVDRDIEYRLQVSGAKAFVGDAVAVGKALKVRNSVQALRHVVQINSTYLSASDSGVPQGVVDFHAGINKISPDTKFTTPAQLKPTSPALTFFTSGTTGPPKLVQHNQISSPLAHSLTGTHWLRLRPPPAQSVYWNLSEQGWAKAAWSFFSSFTCGACLFVHDDRLPFTPRRTLEVLAKYDITTICAPPTVWRQLVLDEQRSLIENGGLRPKALKWAVGAGEPLAEGVIRKWQEITGLVVRDGYGQTETMLLCANWEDEVNYGSMGRPLPGVPLHVIDNEGKDAQPDVEGDVAVEIIDKGRKTFMGIFDGYVDMQTGAVDRRLKTFAGNDMKVERTFYLTGDRATYSLSGHYTFIARADDVINSAGYRIGPFEVESTLKLHPSVVESAVVASPDPQREEVVKAFIVLTDSAAAKLQKAGKKGEEELTKELQEFCKKNAAPYKYPRKVQFVDARYLPKTISGKIRRKELKEGERERYRREMKGGKVKL